jgi:ABC-type transporter Mla subunit MlaD
MTAPSKLDEARLRELAEAVRDSRAAYDTAAVGNSAALWRRFASASDDLDGVIQPVETTILALLDALSAERERGDRAVENAAIALQALNGIPEHRIVDGMTVQWSVSDDVPEDIYTAKSYLELATQSPSRTGEG